MKVSAIMTTNVCTLSEATSVSKAIEFLTNRKISGLPVVDNQGKLVGMFTEKDILRAILPGHGAQAGKPLDESDPLGVKNRVEQLSRNTVGELMRRDVVKLSAETPISEAARIMLMQNVRRVPVVDAQERLRGIIARSDIMTALLKQE